MTTYTTPHSLPILETGDKIAATDDGLRLDINAVSQAAATAITAEGARAETAAKSDATTKYGGLPARVTAVEAKNVSQDTAIAGAVTTARAYTDTREVAIKSFYETSNIAIDTDGAPYIRLGSTTAKILQDTDGTPYYEAA